jgi:hypothetical protein
MFARALIVDLAEGAIFEGTRASIDRAKQVITQTHDEYRIAYSRTTRNDPRGFVFVGTTNRVDQLGDHTGSRRFLNLETTHITRLPYQTKLQILAEVAYKEQALRVSPWYTLKVGVDQAPEHLRVEGSHITSVQELINSQYQRPTMVEDFIIQLLDAGEVVRAKNGDAFISAPYIWARYPDKSMRSAGIGRILSSLAVSPTCKYILTPWRPVLSSLLGSPSMLDAYTGFINNRQMMLTGYRCVLRPGANQQDGGPEQADAQE